MNIPCKFLKPTVDGKFMGYLDGSVVNLFCDTASTITARYYKGIGASGDNMVLVLEKGEDLCNGKLESNC